MLPINPHPPLVMFASSLGGVSLLFELLAPKYENIFSKQIRFILLSLFLLACIASYYSGFYGTDFATNLPEDLIRKHQGYARFGLILLLAEYFLGVIALLSSYTSKGLLFIYRVILLLTVGIMIYTSHLGGRLVFEHGGGVKGLGYSVGAY